MVERQIDYLPIKNIRICFHLELKQHTVHRDTLERYILFNMCLHNINWKRGWM